MKPRHIVIIIIIMFQLFILAITYAMLSPIREYNENFAQYGEQYDENFCPYCGQEYQKEE